MIKKSWIILLFIFVFLEPVLATDLKSFINDIKANPNNYYVFYDGSEQPIINLLYNFSRDISPQNPLIFSSTKIDGKKSISVMIDDNAPNYLKWGFSYFVVNDNAPTIVNDSAFIFPVSYSSYPSNFFIYLTVENGLNDFIVNLISSEQDTSKSLELWSRVDPNLDGTISGDEILTYNLKIILEYLLNYSQDRTESEWGWLDKWQIYLDTPVPSSMLSLDNSIYKKEIIFYNNRNYEEFCYDSYWLYEFYANETTQNLDGKYVLCNFGCCEGACLQNSMFTLNCLFSQFSKDIFVESSFKIKDLSNIWLEK